MVRGYVRVSTTRQAEEGESLETQEHKVRSQAGVLGLTMDKVYIERGVSGSKPLRERPEGVRMLTEIEDGDVVIATRLDRMFRSALDALATLEEFKRCKVKLYFLDLGNDPVTGNGISKLVFNILTAVAEAERDRIRERVTEVKADQKRRGRFLGGRAPFGWTVAEGGELVRNEQQQAAIVKMRKLADGGKSLRTIASEMQSEGFTLSHVGVKEVLKADTMRSLQRKIRSAS
jgi:putative DNA-invertase from lambdoid prophage Rac